MDREDGLTPDEYARMKRYKEETANGLLGPGITSAVLVKPKKLLQWAKAGILDPKLLPERLKATMLRLSKDETLKIIGDNRGLDDVVLGFELKRVDGVRIPILRRLLEAERNRDTPRKKTIDEIEGEMRKALGQTKASLKLAEDTDKQEDAENQTGAPPEE